MEASISSPILAFQGSKNLHRTGVTANPNPKPIVKIIHRKRSNLLIGTRKVPARIPAITDVSAAADPAQAELTWQIVVGAIAGVTPFVVAGIEFSKRIVAQRRCGVCGGSGLVLREKYYFRCPGCAIIELIDMTEREEWINVEQLCLARDVKNTAHEEAERLESTSLSGSGRSGSVVVYSIPVCGLENCFERLAQMWGAVEDSVNSVEAQLLEGRKGVLIEMDTAGLVANTPKLKWFL
ncbi:hypothetical protein HHK36_002226 [Tetracentron sinense]|uniref:Uncharacterized protein n=1 Tax=Tetracentron sinense TaxID=13715 RepID=A0A835DSB8_TETSI|nr:hypothetical protein HHK36_002226 [Tetracentron sinense]